MFGSHLLKVLMTSALVGHAAIGAQGGHQGPIPPGDFEKAQKRLYEYAKQVSTRGPFHNKWIRMSSGGGTYEPPYVSVGFSLADGSGAGGLVNVATGEVKDYLAHTTLLPPTLPTGLANLATRAREMLKADGVTEKLDLFYAQSTGPQPWLFVFEDPDAFKYPISVDSTFGKRVLTPTDQLLAKYEETLYKLGAQRPLRFPLIPALDLDKPSTFWVVDGGDLEYEVFQNPRTGEIASIEFNPHDSSIVEGRWNPSTGDFDAARRALRILGAGAYILNKGAYEFKNTLGFSFTASKFGLPFFGYYGSIRLEEKTHRLISYQGPFFSELPPVNSNRPVLTGPTVAARAKVILDAWMKDLTASSGYKHSWTSSGQPELGYYLPKGQHQGRLVWRQLVMISRNTGYAIQGGSNGIYIDALTGERVPSEHAL